MFEFTLSEQMTAVIAEALSNHRFKDAAPVIQEMQKQINAQRPMPQANGQDKISCQNPSQ